MKLCDLCQVDPVHNFHHFVPRTTHTNRWFQKRYTREEMKQGIHVCHDCHHMIHEAVPSEKELGRNYNTIEKLREHPIIATYLRWKRR